MHVVTQHFCCYVYKFVPLSNYYLPLIYHSRHLNDSSVCRWLIFRKFMKWYFALIYHLLNFTFLLLQKIAYLYPEEWEGSECCNRVGIYDTIVIASFWYDQLDQTNHFDHLQSQTRRILSDEYLHKNFMFQTPSYFTFQVCYLDQLKCKRLQFQF